MAVEHGLRDVEHGPAARARVLAQQLERLAARRARGAPSGCPWRARSPPAGRAPTRAARPSRSAAAPRGGAASRRRSRPARPPAPTSRRSPAIPMSAARAIVRGLSASRTVTSTGPLANSTVSEISASPCSSSPSSTTKATSGSSRAISSVASRDGHRERRHLVAERVEDVAQRAQILFALIREQDPKIPLARSRCVSGHRANPLLHSSRPGRDPRRTDSSAPATRRHHSA